MIISIVTETFWPDINGVAMTLNRWVTGLLDKKHEVQLFCPQHTNRDFSQYNHLLDYHAVIGLPIPGYAEANFGLPSRSILKKTWKSKKPDVIYVATEGPLGWVAINLANKLNIPVLSGFHTNFQSYSKHYQLGFLEKMISRYLKNIHNKTLATIVPTETQKKLVSALGIESVAILGRGADINLFSPAKRNNTLRQSWGVDDETPVLIYVGRIAAEKNLELAIETYRAYLKLNNKIKFVFVGSGPLEQQLKKDYSEFIFVGKKVGEELATYYASCDIFLFPSLTETFGNVVLEAMASGLGLVAFDYAAASLHVEHQINGLVASYDNAQEFIDVARQYIEDLELLKNVKSQAREYAMTQSWDNIVTQFEKLLLTYSGKPSPLDNLTNSKAIQDI